MSKYTVIYINEDSGSVEYSRQDDCASPDDAMKALAAFEGFSADVTIVCVLPGWVSPVWPEEGSGMLSAAAFEGDS